MSYLNSPQVSASEKSAYAVREEFEQLFAKHRTDLLRLSLQLTADARKADTCLNLAMKDCLCASGIARDHLRVWARRTVINHAIRLAWGITNDSLCKPDFEFHLQPSGRAVEKLQESTAILGLPVLDRLAFVICVLERHSILDCALLLRQKVQIVQQAIVRAGEQLLKSEKEQFVSDGSNPSDADIPGAVTHRGNSFEYSCGSMLEHDRC
jgi:DNA-directed RNA polymerase specialized sigma24 family protein